MCVCVCACLHVCKTGRGQERRGPDSPLPSLLTPGTVSSSQTLQAVFVARPPGRDRRWGSTGPSICSLAVLDLPPPHPSSLPPLQPTGRKQNVPPATAWPLPFPRVLFLSPEGPPRCTRMGPLKGRHRNIPISVHSDRGPKKHALREGCVESPSHEAAPCSCLFPGRLVGTGAPWALPVSSASVPLRPGVTGEAGTALARLGAGPRGRGCGVRARSVWRGGEVSPELVLLSFSSASQRKGWALLRSSLPPGDMGPAWSSPSRGTSNTEVRGLGLGRAPGPCRASSRGPCPEGAPWGPGSMLRRSGILNPRQNPS